MAPTAALVELALLGLIGSGEIRRFDAIHLASLAMVIGVPMLGLAVLARLMLDRDLARRVALPAAAVLLLPAVIRGFLRRARGRVAGTARAMRAPHGVYVVRGDVDHGTTPTARFAAPAPCCSTIGRSRSGCAIDGFA